MVKSRFSWLPVTEDSDEAPFVYGFLADLVESNNPHILGENNANLPRYSVPKNVHSSS